MTSGFVLLVTGALLGATPCESVIHGQVLDAQSGEPLSRTRIQSGEGDNAVRSDSAGHFRLEGLCPGKVRLRAVRSDYALRELTLKVDKERQVEVLLFPMRVTLGDELVVHAPRVKASDTRSVVSLEGDALLRTRGKSLADALAALPGVTVLRNGMAAKPVVRGQYGARVLKLYDGVRHEGQDWGLDHSPEIDPFAAGAMRVVKGAAGVRYGPDAIAGVLLIEPPLLLEEPGFRIHSELVGALNGKRGTVAARVDGNHAELSGLSWRVDGNYSRGAGLMTPLYPLDNTGIEEWNVGAMVSYRGDCWDAKVSYRRHARRNGICLCVRNETTADFEAQLLRDTPLNSELYLADYEIERPFQMVTHDVVLARARVEFEDIGELEGTYAFQLNDREEFDIVRTQTSNAQFIFTLRSHTADILFRHAPTSLGEGLRLEGLGGVSGILQENVYRGVPLLSDYRAFGVGVFALERLIIGRFELEAGARFDHMTREAHIPVKTYESLVREERISPEACVVGDEFTRCPSAFNAGTLSLGGLMRLNEGLTAKLDLSTATRFPTIDEQYISGASPAFPVMARGLGSLGTETSWSLSGTFEAAFPWLSAELSVYGSFIDDYIYLAPELRDDGTVRTDVLISGRYPRFAYEPVDAVFYGVDTSASLRLGRFDLSVQGSLVRATNVDSGEFLLFIPSDRLRTEVTYRPPDALFVRDTYMSISATMVAPQYNVSPEVDFAPVPDGYVLLGASVGTKFEWGEQRFSLSVEAQNLLNTSYRDYTSLLRYYSDEPGLQVLMRLGAELSL
ncbi:MAG: TonB-dependent receptor [Myxococcota bacterium]